MPPVRLLGCMFFDSLLYDTARGFEFGQPCAALRHPPGDGRVLFAFMALLYLYDENPASTVDVIVRVRETNTEVYRETWPWPPNQHANPLPLILHPEFDTAGPALYTFVFFAGGVILAELVLPRIVDSRGPFDPADDGQRHLDGSRRALEEPPPQILDEEP